MAMRVFLDGRLIDERGTTLGAALDRARAIAPGRLLVEVLADGRSVRAEHLDNPPSESPYAERLEMRSEEAGVLIVEALRGAAEALGEIRRRQDHAADLIHSGRVGEAVAEMASVLELWESIRSAIDLSLRAGGPAGYDERAHRELVSVMEELASSLGEVRRALAGQDWAGLADLLGWDMRDRVESCRGWLSKACEGRR